MMLFLAAALTLNAAPAPEAAGHAQADADAAREARMLAGVVTDATLSLAGHAFYTSFCAFWHDKPMNGLFAVAIREQLSARRGNQVIVEYAGRVIFRSALPPASANLAPLGEQAVEISYETAMHAEVQRLLFSQDELAPDEL
jgi:curli production assembly/transport component CsgE